MVDKERFAMSKMTLTWAQKVKLAAVLMLVAHSVAGYYAFVLTKLVMQAPSPAATDAGDGRAACCE